MKSFLKSSQLLLLIGPAPFMTMSDPPWSIWKHFIYRYMCIYTGITFILSQVCLTFASIKWPPIMGIRASTFSKWRLLGSDKPACGPSAAPIAMTLVPDDFLSVMQTKISLCHVIWLCSDFSFSIFANIIISTLVYPCWSGSKHTRQYRLRRCSHRPWSQS